MIDERITNELFAELGIDLKEVKLLGGYNGNVFEVGTANKYVIKIMERASSPEANALAELEWLLYLHSQGMRVPRPLRLKGNEYMQQISEEYYCIAFEKINGSHVLPSQNEGWGNVLFEKWGEAMGRLHFNARGYSTNIKRPHWSQNNVLLNLDTVPLKPQLVQKWNRYLKDLSSLPISSDHFGLIHGDLHHENLILTGDEITILDFGDSEYHWFVYDIAIAVYHSALTVSKTERDEFAKSFFNSFMNGYARGNSNTAFLKDIDYFLDYRHFYSFTYHSMHLDTSIMTEKQLDYLKDMELSLIHETPFLGVTLF